MKANTNIKSLMTVTPHTVNSGLPIKTARDLMKKYGVRHLPVQVAGHLVGVVTDRDLKLALSFQGDSPLLVDDVMTPDPYAVAPEASLGEVVREMARRRYGCAIVRNAAGRVLGIFTVTDGMSALERILRARTRLAGNKKVAARKKK